METLYLKLPLIKKDERGSLDYGTSDMMIIFFYNSLMRNLGLSNNPSLLLK
jgi:hypothetical protein